MIDGFEIRKQIGKGGMGVVYAAFDKHRQKDVALKVLLPDCANDPVARQRFEREARILMKLNQHPGIVTAHEFKDPEQGAPFLVMELLEQGTLADWIREHHGRDIRVRALVIARQIADTMADVHAKSYIHRDLKPENIMLVADENEPLGIRPKVCDFGIAKICISDADYQGTTQQHTRGYLGTQMYSAPEQFGTEKVVDEKADVYALGLILHEMLAGKRLFQSDEQYEEIYARNKNDALPLNNVSPIVAGFLLRMLARKPAERPSMQECAQTLAKWGTDEAIEVAVPRLDNQPAKTDLISTREKHKKQPRPWWILVASVVVVAIVTPFAMVWNEKHATERDRRQAPIPSAKITPQVSAVASANAPASFSIDQFEKQIWDLRDDLEKTDELRTFQYEALETVRREETANPGARRLDHIIVLYELSEFERTHGTLEAAEKYANEALLLVEVALKQEPKKTELISAQAMSLSKRGKVWLAKNKLAEAKADFEASIDVLTPLNTNDSMSMLATSRLELGQAQLLGDDVEAAYSSFTKVIPTRAQIAQSTPDPYWSIVHAQALLWHSKATNDVSKSNVDLDNAYSTAAKLLGDWRAKAVFVSVHNERAKLFILKRAFSDARTAYSASLALAKPLVAAAPTHKDNALLLIETLVGLEKLAPNLKDPALVRTSQRERCEVAKKIVDKKDKRFVFDDCKP